MTIKPREGCDRDIVDALEDLHKQATLERPHFYVGKTVVLAAAEIKALRWQLEESQRLLALYDDGVRPADDHPAKVAEAILRGGAADKG